jgi:hypothetical protein
MLNDDLKVTFLEIGFTLVENGRRACVGTDDTGKHKGGE